MNKITLLLILVTQLASSKESQFTESDVYENHMHEWLSGFPNNNYILK